MGIGAIYFSVRTKGPSYSDPDLVVFPIVPAAIVFISPILSRDDLLRTENLVKKFRINQMQIAFNILSNG